MKDLAKKVFSDIQAFAAKYGESISKVYSGLIDYIAGYLDYTGRPVDGWGYNAEQNACFMAMTIDVFKAIDDGIKENGWYDLFGDVFMMNMAEKGRLGQCFTPEGLSNICAKILLSGPDDIATEQVQCGTFGTRHIINDPACGSGRLVLAGSCEFHRNTREYPYVICEDIDSTCCKQTAINLALHGWYGEVVCHNSLGNPDEVRFGYIVNEGLYPDRYGMPTLRYSTNPSEFIVTRFWKAKKEQP